MKYFNNRHETGTRQSREFIEPAIIVPAVEKLKNLTNNSNLNLPKDTDYYNCWGFTAFAFGWLSYAHWFEYPEMNYCLDKFTTEVKNPKDGDIIVFRENDGYLVHTAIYVDVKENKIIHKPGRLKMEVCVLDYATERYEDNFDVLTYRRAKKNKKFDYEKFNRYERRNY